MLRALNVIQFKFCLLSEISDLFEPGRSRKGILMGAILNVSFGRYLRF